MRDSIFKILYAADDDFVEPDAVDPAADAVAEEAVVAVVAAAGESA